MSKKKHKSPKKKKKITGPSTYPLALPIVLQSIIRQSIMRQSIMRQSIKRRWLYFPSGFLLNIESICLPVCVHLLFIIYPAPDTHRVSGTKNAEYSDPAESELLDPLQL